MTQLRKDTIFHVLTVEVKEYLKKMRQTIYVDVWITMHTKE